MKESIKVLEEGLKQAKKEHKFFIRKNSRDAEFISAGIIKGYKRAIEELKLKQMGNK